MPALTAYSPYLTINAAGRTWKLERAADLETLWENMGGAGLDDDERIPYWTELWPSSLVLADWLASNAQRIQHKTCLDLGCGLGLCSLVGQSLEARVIGMDYEADALLFARRNALHNNVESPLWTVMDWRSPAIAPQSIDIVWGGDIMYERRFVEPVLSFLEHTLAPTGVAWVAEPGRSVYTFFQEALNARNWQAKKVHKSIIPAIYKQPKDITVHLWELSRPHKENKQP